VNSEEEIDTIRMIKGLGLRAKICGLARCVTGDVDACIKADVDRVHIFIATSDVHLKYKLRMDEEQALRQAVEATDYVKAHGLECEFSCEDATRTPLGRLVKFYGSVDAHGADINNVPDTVGVMEPEAMQSFISELCSSLKKPVSMHCHNDFGMAVANTLAGIKAGASQMHVTVNGLGERAGNASLEQAVTALETMYGVKTGIKLNKLKETSKLVERASMIRLTPNYPIVGDNAFAHEAGIHQHGVMANRATYEIMTPESIGLPKNRMVLGKHSGRHAFEDRLKDLGFKLDTPAIDETFAQFKVLADKKKVVSDRDIEALVVGSAAMVPETYKLDRWVVNSGSSLSATSTIRLQHKDGTFMEKVAVGDGPIDASFKAINSILGKELELESFELGAITGGRGRPGRGDGKDILRRAPMERPRYFNGYRGSGDQGLRDGDQRDGMGTFRHRRKP